MTSASSMPVLPPYLSPATPPSRMAAVPSSIMPARLGVVRPTSHSVTNIAVAPAATAASGCPASVKPIIGTPTASVTRTNISTGTGPGASLNSSFSGSGVMPAEPESRAAAG